MGANAQIAVPAFTAGQVLTAEQQTQINTGIPVFATTVTRDAAFGGAGEKTLAEGQFAYIEATDTTQYYDGAAWQSVAPPQTVAIFSETQASGTAGGASVQTTYTKRVLNTTIVNNIGATLSASVVALLAGTYRVSAISPHFNSNAVALRLRNTSDNTTTISGPNNYSLSASACYTQIDGTFTISATKNFELQYYQTGAAVATNGLGVQVSSAGVVENYAQITIIKVA
jgi:hypothetical protein